MQSIKLISYLIMAALLASACQRDDICPETTPTTPNLVIKFFNQENQGILKNVHNLNIRAQGQDSMYFETPTNASTISIPLKTNVQNLTYYFTLNSESNDDDEVSPNTDTLRFSYTPHESFIGRACGYKMEYTGFQAFVVREENNDNWIKSISVKTSNIIHEDTTHVYIYH